MASRRNKVAKAVPFNAADLAPITKATPYVQRLATDAKLRDDLRTALDSSKSVYNRLQRAKSPQKALLEDKKLQKDVRKAGEALKEAGAALSDAPNQRAKKRRLASKLLFLLVASAVALAASEKLRSKVLDTLFGAEEEFQYTPPAPSPSTPAASPVTAA